MNRPATTVAILAATALPLAAVEQTITLVPGWNAVWLEVEPQGTDNLPLHPEIAFDTGTNDRILKIASPKPLAGIAEIFSANPGDTDTTFNQPGWEAWRRSDPAGANNLVHVTGNRAYLIELDDSGGDTTVNVQGEVRFHRHTWTPDRFNLTGFATVGTTSFTDFFATATAHPLGRIFELDPSDGTWSVVAASSNIVSNRAYWIFSDGPSDFMGPVAVSIPPNARGQLSFAGPADAVAVGSQQLDLEEVVFTNLSPDPATPELELIEPDPGQGDLDLFVVRPAANSLAFARGNQVDSVPGDASSPSLGETVAPGSTAVLTVGAERNWVAGSVHRTNTYRLDTGGGTLLWLPVSATKTSVPQPADTLREGDAALAGLWVGDLVIDASTSIVEDGAPVRPAAGRAPLRLLLHADIDGNVQLLSQVTLMQTKTADPTVAPVPVLVVDRRKIPFFEGVRERNGKRVGLRLESVAFDMPRKTDLTSQAALVPAIVTESTDPSSDWLDGIFQFNAPGDVTEDAVLSYLQFSSLRPPQLQETYELTHSLEGTIGAGKTLRTAADNPITIDPFHRSNPFRHAFHQKHPRGPNITRTIDITFAPDQPLADRLAATYTETITGITRDPLTLTGTLTLHHSSPVPTLDGPPPATD